jgi:hypothetical protein
MFLSSLKGWNGWNLTGDSSRPHPGICHWIMSNPVFKDEWLNGSQSNLLFVTGESGCGKSCIAKHLQANLVDKTRHVLTFFCNSIKDKRTEEPPMVRYFIKELMERENSFINPVYSKYRSLMSLTDELQHTAHVDILELILKTKASRKVILIIDGLDEYIPSYVHNFLERLHWIMVDDSSEGVKCSNTARVVITCRPSHEVQTWSKDHKHIAITAETIRSYISLYVDTNITRITTTKAFEDDDAGEALKSLIKQLAKNSFLWVYSILMELERIEDTSFSSVGKLLLTCPGNMVDYYNIALDEFFTPDLEYEDMRLLLKILLFAQQPLNIRCLQTAMSIALARDFSSIHLSNRIRRTC